MSNSLYQKYRPQLFSDLVGQDHIRTTLLNELSAKEPSHAYLFSGSRGVGKTTTARILARAVNCLEPRQGEPCNSCKHCTTIMANKALDIIEIDAASHTGVDHVRENIIENARVSPTLLPWKVFIIDEVHMLSTSAFNALLKTLEEPPSHTMFILATTELHKVPATIISRCEQFQFKRVAFEHMVDRLADLANKEEVTVDRSVFEAIARRSDGALRDAESLLGQVLSLDDKHITAEMAEIILPSAQTAEQLSFFEEIVHMRLADAVVHITRLVEEGVQLHEFSKDIVEFLRSVLLYRVQSSLMPLQQLNLNADQVKQLSQLCDELSVQQIAHMIEVCMKAVEQYKTSIIPQLPLELAVIELCDAGSGKAEQAPEKKQPIAPKSTSQQTQNPATKLASKQSTQQAATTATIATETAIAPAAETSEAGATPVDTTVAPARTFDDVKARWTDVLAEMRHRNHSLHLSLQVGTLVSFDGHVLVMGYQYQFYQDRLHDVRNRPVIDEALQKVLGGDVILETVVGKQYSQQAQSPHQNIEQPTQEEVANVWDLAASTFGQHG